MYIGINAQNLEKLPNHDIQLQEYPIPPLLVRARVCHKNRHMTISREHRPQKILNKKIRGWVFHYLMQHCEGHTA